MMLPAPRFIAIDDKQHHLTGLLGAFQEMGAPCLGIHFTGDEITADHFRHARVIFMDLHLADTGSGTTDNQHYNTIAGILWDCMRPQCGPFILVLWTEHPEKCSELEKLLDERLVTNPHCRPLAILPLGKSQFIDLTDGTPKNPKGLLEAVRDAVSQNPQLSALLAWEGRAMDAASATLGALLDLVPADKRSAAACGSEIDRLLSILAIAAVGKTNVGSDPQGAVMHALAPILADRMSHVEIQQAEKQLWVSAVTRVGEKLEVTAEEAGRVNQMLHLAIPDAETLKSTDRGAVVDLPDEWLTATGFKSGFGVKPATAAYEFGIEDRKFKGTLKWRLLQIQTSRDHAQAKIGLQHEWLTDRDFESGFDVKPATIAHDMGVEAKKIKKTKRTLKWRLLQIQASCDYAQAKIGLQPYVLALEVPLDMPWKKGERDALWCSPVLSGEAGLYRLVINSRFRFGLSKDKAEQLSVRYRLREQLLSEAVHHVQSHGNRPGIVFLA
ncbi:MAG: hypothetical protein JHC88_15355, partial [Niveispirillum sp.]|nr:hypothetical protein [Niveispirillum sp.]